MDFLYVIFTILATVLLLLLGCFLALLGKIFTGKSIRNPKYPPVSGTVLSLLINFNRIYEYLTEVAEKHQTFRLLAQDQSEIYTTDARNIEHILKSSFDKYSKGQYLQGIANDLFGHGIFVVDGVNWKQQRKLASYEFSTRMLRDFSCDIFRKNAVKLITTVSESSMVNDAIDMQDLLMKYSLDSIFKVGFGADLNCMEGSNGVGSTFIKAFDDTTSLIYWRYIDPTWKVQRLLNIGFEASLAKNIKYVHRFVQEVISKKREQMEMQQNNQKEDILSRFLIESKKDPEKMNDQYLRDLILNFILAGKDTTANTLSWFFYMLCKNPQVQERIVQEIKATIQGNSIDEFVENTTDEALEKMHYLHAALSETLRLYPAVPVDGRCAEADDILPDGYRVKKGDNVYYIAYAMGRMTNIWGDDAKDFKPDRWLNNGFFQPESPFKFIAFHAGPRICLGKDFAYRQMKIVSIGLLRYFRFKLADEKRAVTYIPTFTLHVNGGLHLLAISRPD
ncbi:cytochrome P450 704C1-like [Apium graveolens]|uniref:cytochrome P450 704C1-like n=1 Tax=Apium graveolens TaxID=4045 RepID=UPI003D7BAE3D